MRHGLLRWGIGVATKSGIFEIAQNHNVAEALTAHIISAPNTAWRRIMKHIKPSKPTDADLHPNPMIGASKGAAMAQVTADDLEEFAGANTIEGDIENDTNPQGGIDKPGVINRRKP